MANIVNNLSFSDSIVITEQLASSLSANEQLEFFSSLSSENKIAFWEGRTQRLAREYSFSPEQLGLINKMMQLETEFRRGNIGQAEVQAQSVFLEAQMQSLFEPELARLLSSVVL